MSAKLLSMLETSLTNSVEPASAATYSQDTIEKPYHYTHPQDIYNGYIQLGDLEKPKPPEKKAAEQEVTQDENKVISWIRSLIIPTAHAAEPDVSAKMVSINTSEIVIEPGKAITVEAKFKNVGNYTWTNYNYNFVALATVDPVMRYSDFQHSFWERYFRVARISESTVKPGEIATVRFAIQAPHKPGEYIEKYQLVARRLAWIDGGEINLYINVGNVERKIVHQPANYERTPVRDAQVASTQYDDQHNPAPKSDINKSPQKTIQQTYELGPTMRVGLYSTILPITVTANGPYQIKDSAGLVLYTKHAGEGTSAFYNKRAGTYIISSDSYNASISKPIRFELTQPESSYFTITSYDARPSFNPRVNYNDFRYILELRYTPQTDKIWIINELPMEKYLLGISETHKEAPYEFLKSMTVAARTYAMYHQERQTKHADEHFTVDSKYDQVYRGAAIEEILTDWKRAVEETNGQVVTYDGKIAITPYFARSDGRTRSFAEVWHNEVPWLQSVSAEYDTGDELLGHGVGMSAVDAMRRAKDGADYLQILHHYYTDVNIENIYQ